MPETKKMICITCPKGCALDVTLEGDTILKVENEGCKRGPEYVDAEIHDPRRMVATTVRIASGLHPLMPCYTAKPFPRPKIKQLLASLRKVQLKAPVKMGDVILPNALGTGIDVVASRDMGAAA